MPLLTLLAGLLIPVSLPAQAACTALVYPEIAEPYRSVFASITAGIKDGAKEQLHGEIKAYALAGSGGSGQLSGWLDREQCRAVITLGQKAFETVRSLELKIPVVAGAVHLTPELAGGGSGISLAASPERLFRQLLLLAPQVKRVHAIHFPARSAWIIALAQQSAKAMNLELVTHEVRDLRSAARSYADLLEHVQGPNDALWLLPDEALDLETLIPVILEQSWTKRLPVFSSNPALVKRGLLFALYPDNRALGASLARLAAQRISDPGSPPVLAPLTDLLSAVNLRTAEHLGLEIDAERQRGFTLLFPEP